MLACTSKSGHSDTVHHLSADCFEYTVQTLSRGLSHSVHSTKDGSQRKTTSISRTHAESSWILRRRPH